MSRARTQQSFQTIRSEGGLLPIDILQRIAAQDKALPGLTPDAYHLPPGGRFGEAVSGAWSRVLASWRNFQDALARLPENDPATTLTREKFLLPLFEELKFGRLPKKTSSFEVDGRSYAISHEYHRSPIHMLGCRVSLEDRVAGLAGAAKSSPHGLVQDLLNRSEQHLWGFVSNGLLLRILRDHHSLTQQAYVEFDLQAMLDGEHYSDFVLLWLLCHQSRIEAESPEECWLERWMQAARDEGVSALDKLRTGVEQAIAALGTGFIKHPRNATLKADLHSGNLDKQEYFRELRNLVYRCIFLFVAEDRSVLLDPNAPAEARTRYERFYSTSKLRTLSDRRRGGPHGDLWQGLRLVMDKLYEGCPELGLPALGSFLWSAGAIPNLRRAECANEYVLAAVRALCFFTKGNLRFLVNWRQVGADELGSIFESLLELHPRLNQEAGTFELDTAAGHERKTTGSYYTPSSLVDCLLDTVLDPVVDAAVAKKNREEAERALLNLKVCDPACGSGHFLVAAARRIAKRLAAVRTGDDEPSPKALQHALRDVVGHCIFGVDVNKMAVELCRVALWMEAIEPGRPLSFLDNHIQHGNSLLSATPALLKRGIPDEAFEPIEGDDKEVAKRLKKRNRDFRKKGQTSLEALLAPVQVSQQQLTAGAIAIEEEPDDALPAVRKKESDWLRFTSSQAYQDAQLLSDLWCAAFLWPKQAGDLEANAPTDELCLRATQNPQSIPPVTKREVRNLAQQYQFFHWHLRFPQVFEKGGFDVVLGNPPWERLKLQEQEWFSNRDPSIAAAANAASRRAMIADLRTQGSDLFREFKAALRAAEAEPAFLRSSGSFPLCGCGRDINTAAVFLELMDRNLAPHGQLGCITPASSVLGDTTKDFVATIMKEGRLRNVFHFENEELVFPGVHHAFRFCMVMISGARLTSPANLVFYARNVRDLHEKGRTVTLTAEEISLLNPVTQTLPAMRTEYDARLALRVYARMSILGSELGRIGRAWSISTRPGHYHMSNDAELFLSGESVQRNDGSYVPLYESKMMWIFDHRFGTYEGQSTAQSNQGKLPETTNYWHENPANETQSRYHVPSEDLLKRTAGIWSTSWCLVVREISSATSERTVIAAVLPRVATGHTLMLVGSSLANAGEHALLLAVLNSLVLDYLARQKVNGTHLLPSVFRQLPIPDIDSFCQPCIFSPTTYISQWLLPRVLELTYTAWELQTFAYDTGYEGPPFRWDPERRFLLRCELDAAFFHLYGIARDEVDYILETFPILKKKDIAAHGSYRTKEQILDIYDRMQRDIDSGEPYQTLLDPPPADPRVAHPAREPKN